MLTAPAKLSCSLSASVSRRVKLAASLCSVSMLFMANGCLSRSLTGLTIQPATGLTCVIPGVTAQFKAYGLYTESNHATTTQDLSSEVIWSATIPFVASVDTSGLVTGDNLGVTTIVAQTRGQFGALTATSSIQVKSSCTSASVSPTRALTSVRMIPNGSAPTSPAQTSPAQDLVIGTFNERPFTADLTRQMSWRPDLLSPQTDSVRAAHAGDALASVSVYKAGSGSGTVTATSPVNCDPNGSDLSCRGEVAKGTAITLWAAPDPGSVFDGWSGKCLSPADNPRECTVSVGSDTSVAAIFDPR